MIEVLDAGPQALVQDLGRPGLAEDPRFATNSARVEHRSDLVPLLEQALGTANAAVWQDKLVGVGVPAGPVATIDAGIEYADSLGLQPTIDVQDASGRTVGRQVRHPISWTPAFEPRSSAPPALGEHTDSVLEWLRR